MTTLYTIILFVYIIAMIVIGIIGAKKSKTSEDYILAGRKLPIVMMAFSVVAGFFGSEVAMGASGTAYTMGWVGGAGIPFGWTLCLIVMGVFFTKKMRAMRLYSIAEYFQVKYGKTVGVLSAILIVVGQLFWIAALNIGMAKTLSTFLGWDYNLSIGMGLLIVLIYTVAGGLWSGVITDCIQFVILAIATIVLMFVSVNAAGGWSNVVQTVPAEQMNFTVKDAATLIFVITGLLSPIFSGVVTPDGNSRLMGGRSPKASMKAAFLSAPLYLVLGIACMIIGFAGIVVFPNIADAEMIYPTFALEYLSPVFAAMVMIGLVSVVMSSADSALLASATMMTKNIVEPLKKKKMEDKKILWLVRIMVIVAGLAAVLIAVLSADVENAMVILNMITAGLWLALAPLIWFGFFWKKANKTAGVATIIFSIVFLLVWYSISTLVNPSFGSFMMSDLPGELICTPIGLLLFVIVAKATYKKDPPIELPVYDDEEEESKKAKQIAAE